MSASPYLEPGAVYGEYEIVRHVGHGANAVVYEAKHVRTGAPFALKIMIRMDGRRRVRIEQEAIFREELRHPNIVPAIDCLDIAGDPALVMEFVEGPSVKVWLRDGEPTLVDVLAVFRGIVEGVRFAHEHQVVHRDLKPSNVLLQPGPRGAWVPRISDLGLAKALAPEVGRFGGLTTVNTGLGDPGYAAPEQVRDASAVGPRADLYSLGCILYEMVCGVAPFAGLSSFDTLAAQRDDRFTAPEHLAPGLPEELYQLIRRLLSADPLRRPADAEAVGEEMEAILDQLAPPVTDGGSWEALHGGPQVSLGAVLTLCAIPLVGLLLGSAVVFGGG